MLIEVDGLSIQLTKKRVKYLNVRIQRTGEVHVSSPLRLPLRQVYDFVREKRHWIEKHRQQLLAHLPAAPSRLETGELLFFLGKRYELKVHPSSHFQRVELNGGALDLYINSEASFEQKQQMIRQWYRDHMQQRLPALFEKWEAVIGVKANVYGIKRMKSRWGSCNIQKKRIWLNLSLIERPLMALEYVIVHELVHLLEASHNKRFYALMSQFMPDFRSAEKLLKVTFPSWGVR